MDFKEIKEFLPSHTNPLCRNAQIVNFERKITSAIEFRAVPTNSGSGPDHRCIPRGRIRRSGPDPDFAATAQNWTTEVTFRSKLSIWAIRHKGLGWLGWNSLISFKSIDIPLEYQWMPLLFLHTNFWLQLPWLADSIERAKGEEVEIEAPATPTGTL